jgi:hypothetical protein
LILRIPDDDVGKHLALTEVPSRPRFFTPFVERVSSMRTLGFLSYSATGLAMKSTTITTRRCVDNPQAATSVQI